eukprot:7479457-Pyramimonas_sp.AAC.1
MTPAAPRTAPPPTPKKSPPEEKVNKDALQTAVRKMNFLAASKAARDQQEPLRLWPMGKEK